MSRALLVLFNQAMRDKAADWIKRAPVDTRVTFQGPKRTLPQNDRMWAMLTEVSVQHKHFGRTYSAEEWKAIFMSSLGREMRFAPVLDGKGFVPLGHSSSNLSIAEMSELIEFIAAWGAENGVTFADTASRGGAPPSPRERTGGGVVAPPPASTKE